MREELLESLGKDAGKPKEQDGKLIVSFSTGQSLHIPINAKISTPFLTASTPRMYFGVCHVVQSCQGILLLSNPSDVPARWSFEHVVGGGAWKKSTAIRVRGFEESPAEIDDPDVFVITPNAGMVEGPTVSVPSAMAAPPKDYNRL